MKKTFFLSRAEKQFLRESQKYAQETAEYLIELLIEDAERKDLERKWFFDEVVKRMHAIARKSEELQ